jgi:hypothetical protein
VSIQSSVGIALDVDVSVEHLEGAALDAALSPKAESGK